MADEYSGKFLDDIVIPGLNRIHEEINHIVPYGVEISAGLFFTGAVFYSIRRYLTNRELNALENYEDDLDGIVSPSQSATNQSTINNLH